MHGIIEKKFNERFPEVICSLTEEEIFSGNKKTIMGAGWFIKLAIQKEKTNRIYVEYYGVYNDQYHTHARIYNDGAEESLETLKQFIAYSPDVPGDRERSTKDFASYNRELMNQLQCKGLI